MSYTIPNELSSRKIHSGLDSLFEILKKSFQRPLFVVGKTSFAASGAEKIVRNMLGDVLNIHEVGGRLPEPPQPSRVQEIDELRPDCIVAIGGGHVIDTAKLLSICLGGKNRQWEEFKLECVSSLLPLLVVPTTAGSGSEATPFAVVYINGVKHSVEHSTLLPDHVFLEPRLVLTNPRSMALASGLDVISHCVESLLSPKATVQSSEIALSTVCSAVKSLPIFAQTGRLDAAEKLLWASNKAGQVIATTRTNVPHALSYFLTAQHGVPHGCSVALTLGSFVDLLSGATVNRDNELWSVNIKRLARVLEYSDPAGFGKWWRTFLSGLGVATSIASLGLQAVDAQIIARNVNLERLANSPVQLTQMDLERLFDD